MRSGFFRRIRCTLHLHRREVIVWARYTVGIEPNVTHRFEVRGIRCRCGWARFGPLPGPRNPATGNEWPFDYMDTEGPA